MSYSILSLRFHSLWFRLVLYLCVALFFYLFFVTSFALILCVSFHFISFHFISFQITLVHFVSVSLSFRFFFVCGPIETDHKKIDVSDVFEP